MKPLCVAIAAAALVSAAAVSASAQTYPSGSPIFVGPPDTPSYMRDDGSSSDHPTHMPSDYSGDALNHAYRHGLTVPPE